VSANPTGDLSMMTKQAATQIFERGYDPYNSLDADTTYVVDVILDDWIDEVIPGLRDYASVNPAPR
jgi:hypothetical protein